MRTYHELGLSNAVVHLDDAHRAEERVEPTLVRQLRRRRRGACERERLHRSAPVPRIGFPPPFIF